MARNWWSLLGCVAVVVVGNALSSAVPDSSGGQSGDPACNVIQDTLECNPTPGYCSYTWNKDCSPPPCGTKLAGVQTETLCPSPPTLACDALNKTSRILSPTKCKS